MVRASRIRTALLATRRTSRSSTRRVSGRTCRHHGAVGIAVQSQQSSREAGTSTARHARPTRRQPTTTTTPNVQTARCTRSRLRARPRSTSRQQRASCNDNDGRHDKHCRGATTTWPTCADSAGTTGRVYRLRRTTCPKVAPNGLRRVACVIVLGLGVSLAVMRR